MGARLLLAAVLSVALSFWVGRYTSPQKAFVQPSQVVDSTVNAMQLQAQTPRKRTHYAPTEHRSSSIGKRVHTFPSARTRLALAGYLPPAQRSSELELAHNTDRPDIVPPVCANVSTSLDILHRFYRASGGGVTWSGYGWTDARVSPCWLEYVYCEWFEMPNVVTHIAIGFGSSCGVQGRFDELMDILAELRCVVTVTLLGCPRLSGVIPTSIPRFTLLRHLYVFQNSLLTGTIPPQLAGVPHLEKLVLDVDGISGSIPSQLGRLQYLNTISVGGVALLSGTVPSQLGNTSHLDLLNFYATGLSGTIPTALGRLSSLRQLVFSSNTLLSGQIPTEVGQMNTLEDFYIYSLPRLSGVLPSQMGNMSALRVFLTVGSGLSGTIPSTLSAIPTLLVIQAGECKLSGTLPPQLGQLEHVTEIGFSRNRLSGSMPPEWCRMVSLEWLDVSGNNLTGAIWPSTCDIHPPLKTLSVSENRFSALGDLANLANLQVLDASRNNLTALAFMSSGQCPLRPSLATVNLAHNPIGTDAATFLDGCFNASAPTRLSELSVDVSYSSLVWRTSSTTALFIGFGELDISGNRILNADRYISLIFIGSQLRSLKMSNLHGNVPSIPLEGAPSLQIVDISHSNTPLMQCGTLQALPASVTSINFSENVFSELPCVASLAYRSAIEPTSQAGLNTTSGLRCNRWVFGPSRAALITNDDYMFHRACACTGLQRFWGPGMLTLQGSTATPNGPALSPTHDFSCHACPEHVHCDPSTTPLHCLKGNVYPVFLGNDLPSPGPYACITAALQRVVFAQVAECRSPVCNRGEATCLAQQNVWANLRSDDLQRVGVNHAAPQTVDHCGPPGQSTPLTNPWSLFAGYWCASGHDPHSLFCSRCARNYYAVGSSCTPCRASFAWGVPLTWALVLTVFHVYIVRYQRNTVISHSGAVALSFGWQWVQLARVITGSNGGSVSSTQGGFGDVLSFRPWAVECVWSAWTWIDSSWVVLISPFALCASVGLAITVAHKLGACRTSHRMSPTEHRILATITTLSLLYVPVLQRILQVLHCETLNSDTTSAHITFVTAAPWISCDSTEYQHILPMAVFCLIVYAIGYPAISMYRLWQLHGAPDHTGVRASSVTNRGDGGGLVLGAPSSAWQSLTGYYLPHTWWWFGIAWFVSFFVVVVTVVMPFQSLWVPILIFLALLAQVLLQVAYSPYRRQKDNWLVHWLVIMLLLLYLIGILQSEGESAGHFQHGVSTVIGLVYALALGSIALALLYPYAARHCFKHTMPSLHKLIHKSNRPREAQDTSVVYGASVSDDDQDDALDVSNPLMAQHGRVTDTSHPLRSHLLAADSEYVADDTLTVNDMPLSAPRAATDGR